MKFWANGSLFCGRAFKHAETYSDKLYTLMLAYALAVAGPLAKVADPSKEKTFAIQLPGVCGGLDAVMAYWFRAKRFANTVVARQRLNWLHVRYTDERRWAWGYSR